MAKDSTTFVIYGAVAANALITAAKFVAAGITGSSAMLAEGIHSAVNCGDTLLLLLGTHLSRRPPDAQHPFGHGRDLYFWTLIVAVMIFGIGGGMGVYEGITHILHPVEQVNPFWNYIVLGIALLADGTSWIISYRELHRAKPAGMGMLAYIRQSKDPSVYTVLMEDSADLLGITAAFLGVYLGHTLNAPWLDGAASVVIGLILALVAVFLAFQTRGLLLGEAVNSEALQQIRAAVEADPDVERAGEPLTMYLGPHQALLNLPVRFRSPLRVQDLDTVIDRLESTIRRVNPDIKQIFIEADSLRGCMQA